MKIFFNSWDSVFRVFITLIFAYPLLIILLRIYGKRSLSKLNMFDFIITVALGSTFAAVVTSSEVTIFDGIVTFTLLLSAQYLITWSSFRWKIVDHLVKSEPTLLYLDGKFLEDDMRSVRVTQQEIYAEVRQNGIACLNDVHAIVLETNGMMSVIAGQEQIMKTTLKGVKNYDPKIE